MMARLQVLYLPSVSDGGRIEPRFAMVADQCVDLSDPDRDALRAFAAQLGAQGCVVLSGPIDLARSGEEESGDEEMAEHLRQSLMALATPAQPQPKKLPPANTTEGKLARMWHPPTDEEDPR